VFKEKLKKLKADLKIWNREVFVFVNLEGDNLVKKVQELDARDDESDLDEQGRDERRVLLAEYNRFLFKLEAILKQKACHQWLQHGDLNTSFFHSVLKWRRARNGLNGVFVDGLWCGNTKVVKDKVENFFKSQFDEVEGVPVRLYNVAFSSVSGEENKMLVEDISEEEVKFAIWSCESSKSPGLDGFNFGFLKFCWEIFRKDVLKAVNEFANRGSWPTGSNASFICLVPKIDNPQQLSDFRPISLVGCLYKIVSKVLSLQLKKVMSKLIDSRQSSFLKGRGILDSVLVANEVLEEVKRRKKRCVYFKVDYEKAYDSVSWEFLFYMLGRLGFCGKWIRWIKSCLESSSVSVLVNGSPTSEFCPKRGLRQGDPLAPFLFFIVAEGLAGVVRIIVEKNLVESLEVWVQKVKVNMLQYADDTLFLCEASFKSVCNLKVILHCFELASGLKVNFSKSRIGGVGVDHTVIQQYAAILNCEVMKTPFKYLGFLLGGATRESRSGTMC